MSKINDDPIIALTMIRDFMYGRISSIDLPDLYSIRDMAENDKKFKELLEGDKTVCINTFYRMISQVLSPEEERKYFRIDSPNE